MKKRSLMIPLTAIILMLFLAPVLAGSKDRKDLDGDDDQVVLLKISGMM